jgi:hypothetical protein
MDYYIKESSCIADYEYQRRIAGGKDCELQLAS